MTRTPMRAPTALSVFPAADGALNFARDSALLARARATGEELIRLYAWDRPSVSFGRNERVVGRFHPARLATAGLDAIRRPTGGRALLHHREITYAVAGPAGAGDTLRATYTRLNTLLADALRRLGVAADIATKRDAGLARDGAICFAGPAPGELVVDGRKLAASAQWRETGGFLQHGSILVDDEQPLLAGGLASGQSLAPVPRPATLREILARVPTLDDFAEALAESITALTGVAPARLAPGSLISDTDVRSREAQFRDAEWTWRR